MVHINLALHNINKVITLTLPYQKDINTDYQTRSTIIKYKHRNIIMIIDLEVFAQTFFVPKHHYRETEREEGRKVRNPHYHFS